MQKVRITRAPGSNGPTNAAGASGVNRTLKAVPRAQATLEAEGGETVVGDVNNDGNLEHMRVSGPRHSQGGVPLAVAPGSFVFSDTRKLRIKDPAVLENFGKTAPKGSGGLTPATIAKQYDVNTYMRVLQDPKADALAKRTAQLMLDNNLQKLSELSLVQEEMKGYPNGIPALGESAAAGLMPQAEFGGYVLPRFEDGGEEYGYGDNAPAPEKGAPVSSSVPQAGKSYVYINDKKVKVTSANAADLIGFGTNKAYIKLENGETLTQKEWDQISSGENIKRKGVNQGDWAGSTPWAANPSKAPYFIGSKPVSVSRTIGSGLALKNGQKIKVGTDEYEVADIFGEYGQSYKHSGKAYRDMLDDTKGIITVKGKDGQVKHLEVEDLADLYTQNSAFVQIMGGRKAAAAQPAAPVTAAGKPAPKPKVGAVQAAPRPAPAPRPVAHPTAPAQAAARAAAKPSPAPAAPAASQYDEDDEAFQAFKQYSQ